MKKVLLMVIDACTPHVVATAMREGKLPNLVSLAEAGAFYPAGSTVFPSTTHVALASLVTGRYPHSHGILGSYWYNQERSEVIYYVGDLGVVWNTGIGNFCGELLHRLNHERLKAKTIFQLVEAQGCQAAAINYFIFRGDVSHPINVPRLLGLLPGMPALDEVHGPSILCLGDFVSSGLNGAAAISPISGPRHWFGLKDDNTADRLLYLMQHRSLPDLTIAYFPDNDLVSHQVGPEAAVSTLLHFDERLGELFAAYGGLDALLEEVCVIITADHAQTPIVPDKAAAAIDLSKVLADFKLAAAGQPWGTEASSAEDLMVCPNMRAVQIYFREPDVKKFHHVVAALKADERVDQVIWCADITEPETQGYRIATRDRGALHFWPGTNGPNMAVDEQETAWSWAGDLRAVDGQVSVKPDGRKVVTFPTYPNAFERIAGILTDPQAGPLWATARPGYEFCIPRTYIHAGGGSHGSLHVGDSAIPLFVAGAPDELYIPEHFRIVDIASLCLLTLGLEPVHPIRKSGVAA